LAWILNWVGKTNFSIRCKAFFISWVI